MSAQTILHENGYSERKGSELKEGERGREKKTKREERWERIGGSRKKEKKYERNIFEGYL